MQIPLQGLGDCNKDDHISRCTSVSSILLLQDFIQSSPNVLYILTQMSRCLTFIENLNSSNNRKEDSVTRLCGTSSATLWVDSTIAEGVQWSKDYAISDPLPLRWGRISVKHKEAAVSAFAAISPGTTDRAVAVKSISAISHLSKSRGKVCFIILRPFCFFHGNSPCFGRIRQKHLTCLDFCCTLRVCNILPAFCTSSYSKSTESPCKEKKFHE